MIPTIPGSPSAEQVKETEARLGDPEIRLSSFIVSNTPSHAMARKWPGVDRAEMVGRNILFQEEDRTSYVGRILEEMSG